MAEDDSWLFPGGDAVKDLHDLARLFAGVFRGQDGEMALAWIRGVTIDRVTGPNVGDAALRHLEGQRFLAARIIKLVEEGRKQ